MRISFVAGVFLLSVTVLGSAHAQVRSTNSGGLWNTASTWIGSAVPDAGDAVVIAAGAEVVLDGPGSSAALTVEAGAALTASSNFVLAVGGPVTNEGTIDGANAVIESTGDVVNTGIWNLRLHHGGVGSRTVATAGVEGDQWITGDVTLEGDNTMSRLDAIDDSNGNLLVQEGATLRFTVPPSFGYVPAHISLPMGEQVSSRGTIVVPNVPSGFANTVVGADIVGAVNGTANDTLWIETHSDQVHPQFTNSVRQWFRLSWTGTSDPARPDLASLTLAFDGSQLAGLNPNNLFLYHSVNGGASWTQVTESFQVIYDPNQQFGFAGLSASASEGDYVFAGPDGPTNAPPVTSSDLEFTMRDQSVAVFVLNNDSDPDGDDIRIDSAIDGDAGTTQVQGNVVVYTPEPGFTGDDSFTYVVTDDVGGFSAGQVIVRVADPAEAMFLDAGEEQLGGGSEVVRRRVATLNASRLAAIVSEDNGSLALNLFDDQTLVLDRVNGRTWPGGGSSWLGSSDRFGDWITLEYNPSVEQAYATVWAEGRPYAISRREDGLYNIDELDLSRLLDETGPTDDSTGTEEPIAVLQSWEIEGGEGGPAEVMPGRATGEGSSGDVGNNTPGPAIDLLILFTTSARDSSGSQFSMNQAIINAVNNTNQTYRNSGVNAVVRLAGTAMVQYNETGDSGDDLGNLKSSGEGTGTDIATLREQFGADVVGLVTGSLDACGRAFIMENVSINHEAKAYFVVQEGNCLGSNLSFAHEIGHIQGARHDRFVDGTDGSPYNYNHGFVNPPANWTATETSWGPNQWRTVMAYNDACDCADETNPCPADDDRLTAGPSCTRLMWWSSPNNTWTGGNVMGIASGSNAANNVRTLNNTASTVAAFRGALPAVSGVITDISTGTGLDSVEVYGVSPSQGFVTNSDAAGFYALLVPTGTQLDVTPSREGYVFEPPTVSYTSVNADVVQDFTAYPTFTVSGRVRFAGNGIGGIEIRRSDGGGDITDSAGNYEITLPYDWPGTLTPYHPAYDFSPPTITFDTLRTDVTENITATLKRYTIEGSIRSLSGGVAGVVLDGLPGDPATDANGNYSVTVDHGFAATVTPTLQGYSFEPFSRTYVNLSLDLEHDYDAYRGGLARSEWPMWAGSPSHRGVLDIATFSNQVSWSATVDGTLFPPVIGQDGTVYAATSSRLYAIDPAGSKLWDEVMPNAVEASPAVGTAGRVYVPSGGVVIAFNTATRSADWSFFTGDRIQSSPLIDGDGNVYVGSLNDSLFAISPDGDRLWAFGADGPIRTSPALTAAGDIVFGSDDGSVYAVSKSGAEVWSVAVGSPVRSSPTVSNNGDVIAGTESGDVVAWDAASGAEQWRFSTGGAVDATVALDSQGGVYFGSADSTFYALTPTGTLDWTYELVGPVSANAAVSFTRVRQFVGSAPDEEVVYVATENQIAYAFNIRTPSASDRLRWQYFGASTSPVLTRAGLLIGSENSSISRLDALRAESRALVQISILLNDFGSNFDPDRLAAILWLEERGGPLGLLPDIDGDLCTGGPLVIPNCPLLDEFSKSNPLVTAFANQELILGLVEWSEALAEVIAGNSTQGLLGTFPLNLTGGGVTSLVLGGLLNPDGFAPNPDGRSTDLSLFSADFDRSAIADPEMVYLMSGNLSTDAPALDFAISGFTDATFSDLSFGDLSELIAVPPGVYDLSVLGTAPGKNGQQVLAQNALDLTGQAGQIVALYANGFVDPEANGGGPALSVVAASGNGEVVADQSVGVSAERPGADVRLDPVYPNPSADQAWISYYVPESGRATIELFDLLGRRVQTVIDADMPAGAHRAALDGSALGSGVYVLRLRAANEVRTVKLTRLRR